MVVAGKDRQAATVLKEEDENGRTQESVQLVTTPKPEVITLEDSDGEDPVLVLPQESPSQLLPGSTQMER